MGMNFAVFHRHLLPLQILLLLFAANRTVDGRDLLVGSTLTANVDSSPWLSPSGEFAFGFKQLDDKDQFLLSIWFDMIPEKTVIWYANGDKPAPTGSTLQLTSDKGLVLKTLVGDELWRSDVRSGRVTHGTMNDTGNFVLLNSSSESSAEPLWQSFDNPTDTLLPGQTMNLGQMLFSRKTETNFTRGRFQLRFLRDGNLVLNSINLETKLAYDAYYATGTNDSSNSSNSGQYVNFDDAGALYVLRRNGQPFWFTTSTISSSTYYLRATLSFDGVFAQYTYQKASTGNTKWTPFWSQPDNICVAINGTLGSGVCGYNSICSLDNDLRPACACPQGFSLLDANDQLGGCKPDFEPSCEEEGLNSMEDLYGFAELNNTDWPSSDYEDFKPVSKEECQKSCLHDCLCSVAVFKGNNSCSKKKLPLSHGRVDSSVGGKAFIKIRKGYDPSIHRPNHKSRRTLIIAGSILLGSSFFINSVLIVAICLGFFLFYHKKLKRVHQRRRGMETSVPYFTYKELAEATNDFKDELGSGAFGVVYKGMMQIGSTNVIAVKELDSVVVQDGEMEFRTEVNAIGRTHHKNLVQLLGFCDEGQHRLLVYEYVSNGTLAEVLYGKSKPSWSQRTQIAVGIARGLLYLHEECARPIIHCDIKPQNILLDDSFNAQISDFGLAKLLMLEQSQTTTAIRGTRGYIAPEWFRRAPITIKVDVYSFGVTLLEIICCRRNVETGIDEEKTVLIDWAYECYVKGTLDVLVEDDKEALNDPYELERLLKVAVWCIQDDPSLRPSMKEVTQMLEGVVDVPVPPNPYTFSVDSFKNP